jgi:tetratricopeptide (TPR) repeat protein
MALTAKRTMAPRHPWLDRFEREPVAAFGELLAGYARIPPYERADAPDAARMLFGPLPPDDPARLALGPAILGWLEQHRRQSPPPGRPQLQSWVREACEAFEIVSFLDVADAAVDLRRRFVTWNEWTARFVLSPARDARAEYWRMLALTQPLVAENRASNNPNDLASFWVDICAQAGGDVPRAEDVLPRRYLRIGLLGQRRLTGQMDGSESPWVAGLAHWALAQNPSGADFQSQWRSLKPLYPRTPARWRELVGRLLATAAFQGRRTELLDKWRGDPDIVPMLRDHFHMRGEMLRSPGPDACNAVILRLAEPWTRVEPLIDGLLRSEHRFLDATGDAQFFVRSMHRLGRALIQTPADEPYARARKAQALAREGLDWEPYNRHLWSLWREALEADGALEAAAEVGWEFVRRDPDDADARNQLATLLAEALGRPADAEALLRGTIAAFPSDVVARTQLAELLIATDRVAGAEAAVDAAFAADATNGVSYALRARLQTHRGQKQEALATLREGIGRDPTDAVLRDYEHILTEGRTLRLASDAMAPRQGIAPAAPPSADDPALEDARRFGRLRRLRAASETADPAARAQSLVDIQAVFQDDPTFAYAELLAVRHRMWQAGADTMPGFAVAFEQALVDEDKARLAELAKAQPRLDALILVARALLGDEQAAWTVSALLNAEPPKDEARPVTILRNRLRPLFDAANDKSASQVFIDQREAILLRLYDANEAGLGDRMAA